jgi:hypothetical protein
MGSNGTAYYCTCRLAPGQEQLNIYTNKQHNFDPSQNDVMNITKANFATISEPNLLGETQTYSKILMTKWHTCNNLLISEAYHDPAAEIAVTADRLPVGIAANLSQKQPYGNFRPVIYESRTLNDVEWRYSHDIEQETVAVNEKL